VDADMGYSVMARLQMPNGSVASVLFQGSEMGTGRDPNAINFYGTRGTLRLHGYFIPEAVEFYDQAQKTWVELRLPEEILATRTCTEDPIQNAWCCLFREFVADVRGEVHQDYPTFHEGWVVNVIIDTVRNTPGWIPVPEQPENGE
jgi:hypothetical protein